ncbi:sugar ABC transporter substrate-binding protein [bacterium]|nr:sugar ABC transporter substrate-binding protein [bacterium]
MRLKGMVALFALAVTACARPASDAITFSTWGSIEEIETLKPLLADFERENPDVKVKLIHIPDEYPHKIRLLAASGTMPDVLFMESQTLSGFAHRGVLRDMGEWLERDPELKRGDFYRPVLDAMSWKGTLYGIPRDLSNLVIFYNKRLFDTAGVAYPQAGWTYETMVEKAKRLTQGDRQFGIGFAPYPLYWLPYLWSDGGDVMDAEMRRSTLLEPQSLAAMQRYLDLRAKHHVAPTEAQVGNARMSQLFAQGKLAMMVGGRWVVPGFRKKLDFPWDVAPFPRGKTGSVVDADASGWSIAKSSKQPEKAWRLVRYLASKKSIAAFTESGLIVPSRPDVANSPAFLGSGPPASSKVFLDVITSARPTRTPPSYDEIQYELIDGLPPAWNGEADLLETLRPISARIDALLKEDAP